MSNFKVNHITNKSGKNGPVLAGITTVSSSGAMRIPSGGTGSAYGPGNLEIVRDDSLVFYVDGKYSYDVNRKGVWYDLSGRNHNVALHGSTLPTYNSSNGGSVVFSEANGNFGVASINNHELEGGYNGPFTYEIWAYPTTYESYGWVLSTGPDDYTGIGFHAGSGGTTNFMWGRNGGGGNIINYVGGSPALNTWHHIVMTLNNTGKGEVQTGTKERAESQYYNTRYQSLPGSRVAGSVHIADFFKNGTFNQSKDIGSYVYNDPTSYITLGVYGYHNGSTFPSGEKFTGYIGAARIYNRALSDAEILQNYNADKTRFGH